MSRPRRSPRRPDPRQTSFAFLPVQPKAPRAAQIAADDPVLPVQVPVPRRPRHVIRVPRIATQIALPLDPGNLFVDESARQVLERRLQLHLGTPLMVSVTDNRQTMISCRRVGGILRARLHHMFLDADVEVVAALARYLVRRDRRASLLLGRYIEENRIRIKPSQPRAAQLRTAGDNHDLTDLLSTVSRTYFGGDLDITITWGKRPPRGRRRTIKMGTYSRDERLIRIHPALDRSWVPPYFMEYVIFHELLHHILPSPTVDGRMLFHSPEFRVRERTFRHFERALAWEKQNLGKLLRD